MRACYEPHTKVAETIENGYAPFAELIATLNKSVDTPQQLEEFETAVKKVLDIDNFLKVIFYIFFFFLHFFFFFLHFFFHFEKKKVSAFELLTNQIDGFFAGGNYDAYRGEDGKWMIIRFDLDQSFTNGSVPANVNIFLNQSYSHFGSANTPIFQKILKVSSFRNYYIQIWESLLTQFPSIQSSFYSYAKVLHNNIQPLVLSDNWKAFVDLYSFNDFLVNLQLPAGGISGIFPFIEERLATAKEQLDAFKKFHNLH